VILLFKQAQLIANLIQVFNIDKKTHRKGSKLGALSICDYVCRVNDYFTVISNINAIGLGAYVFNDDIAGVNKNEFFYRIKMIDNDGTFKYSSVVRIVIPEKNKFVAILQNPFRDKLTLQISSSNKGNAKLILTDVSGRRLITKTVNLSTAVTQIEIDETLMLSSGNYLLTIITASAEQTIKVIKTQ
jgi:hypothetical protein